MTLDKILVIIGGLLGILFVYWFFMNKKEKIVAARGSVDIKVEGGYQPEVISVPVGKMITLNFTRTDPTPCLEEVVLGDFNIRKGLPLNTTVAVQITPKQKGAFVYSCGMNMYHGKIIVE